MDFKTEYAKLNTSQIVILYATIAGKGYQRKVNEARVKQIVRNFNPDLVNPIKVSYRDGAYYCFDGSHTMHALKMRNGGKDLMVDCKIYYGMTYEDEARMFALQTGNAQAVSIDYKAKAYYESGDKNIIELNAAVVQAGGKTTFSGERGSKYKFACTAALIRCYKAGGAALVTQTVRFILMAWDDDPDAMKGEMVDGVSFFIRKIQLIEKANLINNVIVACRKVAPIEILRNAKADGLRKGAMAVAYYILKAANKRKMHLPESMLEKK